MFSFFCRASSRNVTYLLAMTADTAGYRRCFPRRHVANKRKHFTWLLKNLSLELKLDNRFEFSVENALRIIRFHPYLFPKILGMWVPSFTYLRILIFLASRFWNCTHGNRAFRKKLLKYVIRRLMCWKIRRIWIRLLHWYGRALHLW